MKKLINLILFLFFWLFTCNFFFSYIMEGSPQDLKIAIVLGLFAIIFYNFLTIKND